MGHLLLILLVSCASRQEPVEAEPRRETGPLEIGAGVYGEDLSLYRERVGAAASVLGGMLERDHLAGRYERQLSSARKGAAKARSQTISHLEAFLEGNPRDQGQTPDAMLLLASLAFEESYERFLKGVAQRAALLDRRGSAEALPLAAKDFTRTIDILQRLLAEFPSYRHIDHVLYLLGHCLAEEGRHEEAILAWLSFVCASGVHYEGPIAEEPDSRLSFVLRELGGDSEDPYAACTPAAPRSRLLDEMWLMIGEHHLEHDYSERGLDLAAGAYRNAARAPEGPLHDMATFRLARTHDRADRYAPAVRELIQLAERSDRGVGRGRPGSELRDEALRWLAIILIEEDWNGDGRQDDTTTLQRLQDPSVLPQSGSFSKEVLIEAGKALFELTRYDEAAKVNELVLERWPLCLEAPWLVASITKAQYRNRFFEAASTARKRLTSYVGERSPWVKRHREASSRPVAEADQMIRRALYGGAYWDHEAAHRLGQSPHSWPGRDETMRARYAMAARGYRTFLDRFPYAPDRYEATYNLAGSSFHGGLCHEAAPAFAWVRDSELDDRLREAARRGYEKSLALCRSAGPEEEQPERIVTPPAHPSKKGHRRGKGKRHVIQLDDWHPGPRLEGPWVLFALEAPQFSMELAKRPIGRGPRSQSSLESWEEVVAARRVAQELVREADHQRRRQEQWARTVAAHASKERSWLVVPLSEASAPDQVRDTILGAKGSLSRCFEDEDPPGPVLFSISEEGRSGEVHPTDKGQPSKQSLCIASLIKALRFPPVGTKTRYLLVPGPSSRDGRRGDDDEAGARPISLDGDLPPDLSPGYPEGFIRTAEVRRVLRRSMDELRACYADELLQNPDLRGTVSVQFTIGVTGGVIQSCVVESTLPPQVGRCLSEHIRHLSFPSPEGGAVSFTFPFVFYSAS